MNFYNLLIDPPDYGPVYRETTDLSQFIVEPWNAWSSIAILIPAIIFLIQLRGKYADYPFIVWFCCPLLFTGGLGSTLFHAFRSTFWLMLMDGLPVLILVIGLSIWMWLKVLPRKIFIVPVLAVFIGATLLTFFLTEGQDRMSAGYFIRGLMLLLPCYLFMRKTEMKESGKLFAAIFFFILALVCRFADEKVVIGFMPWGTHWLWHISTGFGAWFLGEYLINNAHVPKKKQKQ